MNKINDAIARYTLLIEENKKKEKRDTNDVITVVLYEDFIAELRTIRDHIHVNDEYGEYLETVFKD